MYVKGCTFLSYKVLLAMDTVHYTQMISMHLRVLFEINPIEICCVM